MSGVSVKKILVVEDDVTLSDVLMRKISLEGYAGYLSSDGRSGLAEAKRLRPDMILLDILLPGLDGFQVLEALRADPDPAIKDIPVIIVSNSGQPVEIERALRMGVKDFFIKAAFDPGDVLAKVKKHIGPPMVVPDTSSIPTPNLPEEALTRKVLIVEDDQFLRDLAVQKLTKEHLNVVAAIDGEDGVAKALSEKPDVILLDILLPGIDGFEVLTRVRADASMSTVPIIMLSNFGQREDIEKAKSLGANGFMVKANFTLDEVVEEVQKVLVKK